MALRRPHKRMKMVGRLAIGWVQASTLRASPSPQPSPTEGVGGAHSALAAGRMFFIAIAHAGCCRHTKV